MNIKELASQVWGDDSGKPWSDSALHHLEKFAELILEQERKEAAEYYLKLIRDCVASERESCAKVCEEFGRNLGGYKAHEDSHDDGWQDACCEIETAIRARGDKHD